MKQLTETDAKVLAGISGAKVIVEVIAASEQPTDPLFMRLHYVNNREGQEFYQKEPMILVPLDYLVEKINYACFMSAALGSDILLQVSGPKGFTDELEAAFKSLVPLMSQQYGLTVMDTFTEEVQEEDPSAEAQRLGREIVEKALGRRLPPGAEVQILKLTGSQQGGHCDCPDCAGHR